MRREEPWRWQVCGSHPGARSQAAAATVAPVFPAEKTASASPLRTSLAATATLASGRARSAEAGSSSMPIAPPESRRLRFSGLSATCFDTRAPSPTSRTSSSGRRLAAATAPETISPGASSPPRASTAMRIRGMLRYRVPTPWPPQRRRCGPCRSRSWNRRGADGAECRNWGRRRGRGS